MTTADFIAVVQAESALPLDVGDLRTEFDELPGWDSVHLLKVLSALEATTGTALPMGRLIEAHSLGDLYDAVVAA
jgi:acyl carrier protein